MRTLSALIMTAGLGLSALAAPAAARDLGGEATGNWGGAEGGGFYFRAELETHADLAALRIWNGTDAVPAGTGSPDLDVADFGLSAFATVLRLEVADQADGSTLRVITEFADEQGSGYSIVEIRFIDFQFTITGYLDEMEIDEHNDGSSKYSSCKVDTRSGLVVENGITRELPPMDSDALNASAWSQGAAYDRGWCNREGEG